MKTLWALEPFHQDNAEIQMMYSLIKQFSPNENEIDIGFIANRDIQSLNLAFDVPDEERYSKYPTRIIAKKLLKAKIPVHQQNILVRDVDTISTTKTVEALLSLAKKQKTDLLAIFTQDKKGFVKYTLGSFAETAMELSSNNLLIVSPKVAQTKKINNIFYACDFNEKSKEDILEMLELSLKLKSKIIIYHHSPILALWKKNKQDSSLIKIKKELDDFSDWVQNQARIKKAKVKIVLDGNLLSLSDAIIKAAKKENAQLIAVTAKTKGIKTFFIGTTTRQVVRASDVPVLVLKN